MKFIKSLIQSTGLRQSLVLTGGNFVATFFSAIGLLLVSRSLGPVHFGEFTVGYSLMIIIVRVQGLGLNVALQKIAGKYFGQAESHNQLSKLFRVGTTWSLIQMTGSLLIGVLISGFLAHLLHIDNTMIILGSFFFASVTLFFEYVTTIFQVVHQFTESVYMMLVQSLLKLAVAAGVFFSGTTQVALVFYIFYLTPLVAILLGLLRLPKHIKIWPVLRSLETEKQLVTIMKHSAVLMVTAGLIDYVDVLFVKHYTTPLETGIYGGISQLASVVGVIGFSLASVLNARVARYHLKAHLDSYLKKAVALAGISILGYLVYLPFTKLSIQLTLGSDYLAGVPFLAILMIASFILLATIPFIALFYAFETHAYFSVSGLGQLAIAVIAGNYLISHYGLEGAVWTKVVTRIFLLVITLAWAYRAYRAKSRSEMFQALA